ncbi:LysR substrate-binding domain-containing protein [Aminobacter ciceronei]|uniref:DNA-binding transcriptional LysR family regulator n=1 Tax=Aminobacter ciceronei TaxID=150723 RepID=A0ABR6C524_9HYPH|nr:LysR substrate-binding domain-containing protein [Aminobacter ciceronei]MBA8906072.1 DNA-binding transcriptional LysR family regulator [Aminobacter ciceronei]MBA9019851.1 DNA-binding transcriptional LysR family regulator [Aminobacter ciceronei]
MIKLSYFETFNAVMLSGSMTGAASLLHTSQPNVSRSISRLEKETGLKLFERVPGKLLPTADAIALFEEVQRSFVGLQKLTETAGRIQRSGSGMLRVGAVQALSLSLIPRAVKRFGDAFPEVRLSIQTSHSDVLSGWVREHTCDIAVISHPDGDDMLQREILYTADGVCIMHATHRLANKTVVTPEDLVGERLITFPQGDPPRAAMDRILLDAGVSVSAVIETSYSAITCSLVMQGAGVAVVNPHVAREYLHGSLIVRPFVPAPRHKAVMIFPKGKPLGRPVANFVEILKALVVEDRQQIATLLPARPELIQ